MDSGPSLKFDLLKTITAGNNIFRANLPPNTYESTSRPGIGIEEKLNEY